MASDGWMIGFVVAQLVVLAFVWQSERRRRGGWLVTGVVACSILTAAAISFADEDMSGRRELVMSHCPSAVEGATTRVTDITDGVVITVRAPRDPVALHVEWLADGAKMTIRADRAEDVTRLQSTTHKRARALATRSRLAVR